MKQTHRALVFSACLGAGLAACNPRPLLETLPVVKEPSKVPTALKKTAIDPNTGAPLTGPVPSGTTIKYVIEADPPGVGVVYPSVSITDTMSSGLAYVPGSLQLPPGWTSAPNPPFTPPPTTVFSASQAGSELGFMLPVSSASSQAGLGSGDGYTPVIVGSKVFGFAHHSPGLVECWNKATMSICSPAASANPSVSTMSLARYVTLGNDIYYPAYDHSTPPNGGVACYHASGMPCAPTAFTSIAPAPAGGPDGPIAGVVSLGGSPSNLFIAIGSKLYCRAAPAMGPCVGVDVHPDFYTGVTIASGPSSYSDILADDTNGQIYVQGGSVNLNCINVATALQCWAPVSHGKTYATLSPYLSPTGANDGVCVHSAPGTTPPGLDPQCYAAGTGIAHSPPAPAALTTLLAYVPNVSHLTLTPYRLPAIGAANLSQTRVMYPGRTPSSGGRTLCFDFATGATCAGFTGWATTEPAFSPRATFSDYGYMTDPADPSCTYGLGHKGTLFRFNTVTGDEGCAQQTWLVPDPKAAFCDGKMHSINWSNVTIVGRPSNLTGGTITIKNGGTTLTTIHVTAGNLYPIGSISYASNPSLTVVFAPVYTGPPPTAEYYLQIGFVSNANPQICYQARASCPAVGGYTNSVTFSAPSTPSSEGFSLSDVSQLSAGCGSPPSTCCPPLSGGQAMADMFTHTDHPSGSGYHMVFDAANPVNVGFVASHKAYLALLKVYCPTVDHLQVTFIPHTAASIGGAWTGPTPAAGFTSFMVNIGASGLMGPSPAGQFGTGTFPPGPVVYGIEARTVGVDAAGNQVVCGFDHETCSRSDRFTWRYETGAKVAPGASRLLKGD